jgi:hypothetical protein
MPITSRKAFVAAASVGLALAMMLVAFAPIAGSSSPPTISGANITSGTSLALTAGGEAYVFMYSTGAANTATPFSTGSIASAQNLNDWIVAGAAYTTTASNSFSTSMANKQIGGAVINGFSSYTYQYSATNGNPVATASVSIPVSANDLVVVTAASAGEDCISVSSPNLSLATQATTSGSVPGIIIADAVATTTQTISVTETSSECATGAVGSNTADLIVVYDFVSGTSTPTSTSGSTTTVTTTVTVPTTIISTTTSTTTSISTTTVSSGTGTASYKLVTPTWDSGSGLWVYEVGDLGFTTAYVYYNNAAILSLPVAIWEGNSFTPGSSNSFAGAPSCSGFDYPAGPVSIPSNSGLSCIAVPGEASGVIQVPIGALYLAVANAGSGAQIQIYLTS